MGRGKRRKNDLEAHGVETTTDPNPIGEMAWPTILALGTGWVVFVAFGTLILSRSMVGASDFYAYICNARDLHETGTAPVDRYGYFPGVYTFWRLVFALGAGALPGLQTAYVATLAVVAVLTGILTGRATRSPVAGVVTAVWMLALAGHTDGFEGCTEPVATVPVLLGLIAWGGAPLRGRRGALRAVALGVGLGLGLYVKQQAGFLSLGALALIPGLFRRKKNPEPRHSVAHVFSVPVAAVIAFAAAIGAEGQGLEPIRRGLEYASSVEQWGTPFTTNLYYASYGSLTVLFAIGLAGLVAIVWAFSSFPPRSREPATNEDGACIAGFASIAVLATLSLLKNRGYGHYLLLGVPFASVAIAITLSRVVERAPNPRFAGRIVLSILLCGLLTSSEPWAPCFYKWPRSVTPPPGGERWLSLPGVARDLELATPHIVRGSRVLVLPSVRNELHLALGTRTASPVGYRWILDLGPLLQKVNWHEVSTAILVPGERANAQGFWGPNGGFYAATEHLLMDQGFAVEASFSTFTVWRRSK
jgi:hypothetical protein